MKKLTVAIAAVAVLGLVALEFGAVSGSKAPDDVSVDVGRVVTVDGDSLSKELTPAFSSPGGLGPNAERVEAGATKFVGIAAAEGLLVIRGSLFVVGADSPAPLEAVEVQANFSVGVAARPTKEAAVTCEAGGEFEFVVARPVERCTVSITTRSERYASAGGLSLEVPPGGTPGDLVLHLFELDTPVTGTVRTREGAPIPGATVKWFLQSTTTDGQGEYALTVSARNLFSISAVAEGFGYESEEFDRSRPGVPLAVDFVLGDELRIAGTVRDGSGRPIEGADVADFYHPHLSSKTDREGRYVLANLPRIHAKEVLVSAQCGGFCRTEEEVSVPSSGDLALDFVMRRGAAVEGIAVGQDGTPLPGVTVVLGSTRHHVDALEVITDEAGTFRLDGVPPGPTTLWAMKPGRSAFMQPIDIPAEDVVLPSLRVMLTEGRTLNGYARGEDGVPVPHARILCLIGSAWVGDVVSANAQGEFVIEGAPENEFQLQASLEGWRSLRQTVPEDQKGPVELVMTKAGALRGEVVDGRTGKPIQEFRVRLIDPDLGPGEIQASGYTTDWEMKGRRFKSSSGHWELGDSFLEAGRVVGVQVLSEGYAPGVARRVVVDKVEGDRSVRIELSPGVDVPVQVVRGVDGEAVRGVRVSVHQEALQSGHDPVWESETAADGRCTISGVPIGRVWMTVREGDGFRQSFGPFEVSLEGEPATIRLSVARLTKLVGEVRDSASGPPLGDVRVTVRPELDRGGPAPVRSTLTDSSGRFAFEDLGPGTYRLARVAGLGRRSYEAVVRTIRIDGRESVTEAALVSATGDCEVRGSLVFPASSGEASSIPVTLHTWSDGWHSRTILSDGSSFTFQGIRAGDHRLSVNFGLAGQRIHGEVEFTARPSRATTVQLDLRRR